MRCTLQPVFNVIKFANDLIKPKAKAVTGITWSLVSYLKVIKYPMAFAGVKKQKGMSSVYHAI